MQVRPGSLGELAVWRRDSYDSVLAWTGEQLGRLGRGSAAPERAEYVLSLYMLESPLWPQPRDLQTALGLLSMPSVLLEREPGDRAQQVASAEVAEQALLRDGFTHAELVDFGFGGTSVGFASWAGVSYHALAPARALHADEIARFELLVQALWCYCSHIIGSWEAGDRPYVDERRYGRRFLKACESQLTVARGTESTQHRLMREAILRTSRLPALLDRAMDVLADMRPAADMDVLQGVRR